MALVAAIYGSCAAAFVFLIGLTLMRGRVSGTGGAIALVCGLTAAWATHEAFPGLSPVDLGPVLDSLRLAGWLLLAVALVGSRVDHGRERGSLPFLLAAGLCAVAIGYELILLIAGAAAEIPIARARDFLHIGYGIAGLLATENLLRNAGDTHRRNLWPFCLALGGMFAFELFLYADRLMVRQLDPFVAGGRGLVSLFAVPLLALAMARNRDWRVDIHVSRTVVFHTAALVSSGIFFLVLATVGALVRQFGGAWGPTFQLLALLGSAVVLVSMFVSSDLRVRLKHLISRHFFSHRFDYRAEWLRFVQTVSNAGVEALPVRVVKALAEIVDSPAGMLWRLRDGGVYVKDSGWNLPIAAAARIAIDDPFVRGFRGGQWIQLRSDCADGARPFDFDRAWLAVPLSHGSEMIAFAVLAAPPHAPEPDWETFDLLRAAGTQAASYLAEEQSTHELLNARLLNEYSKRFAFVIHDIKNLASQLGLVVANAADHIDNKEFQQDMLQTVRDSVARMGRLLSQLQAEDARGSTQLIEPDIVIANLVRELSSTGALVETRLDAGACKVVADRDQFRSMLYHLINNAREAARPDSAVVVSSCDARDSVVIDVVDDGPGMDEDFIRQELFRPFRSTKADGLGIGAYQTREILRKSGGHLDVISKKGVGTIMRVTIPKYDRALQASSDA
jgi:putative PEP-CTERM system histidine kinase